MNPSTPESDPLIERVLPIICDEDEYDDFRFTLGQLKERDYAAFLKVVFFE